jgi:hypothetical protein
MICELLKNIYKYHSFIPLLPIPTTLGILIT